MPLAAASHMQYMKHRQENNLLRGAQHGRVGEESNEAIRGGQGDP